jgi:hypothetical protein
MTPNHAIESRAKAVLASYVSALRQAAETTHRAEDRGVYTSLLASAAVVLAQAVGGDSASLLKAAKEHERLRGQVWLQDPVETESSRIWNTWYKGINGHAI